MLLLIVCIRLAMEALRGSGLTTQPTMKSRVLNFWSNPSTILASFSVRSISEHFGEEVLLVFKKFGEIIGSKGLKTLSRAIYRFSTSWKSFDGDQRHWKLNLVDSNDGILILGLRSWRFKHRKRLMRNSENSFRAMWCSVKREERIWGQEKATTLLQICWILRLREL